MSTNFDRRNFLSVDNTGKILDIFSAKYKNIRFQLPTSQTLIVNSGTEANLPGLAYQLYGDVSLWWVLLLYNGLYDPINDVKPGLVLRIPSKDAIISYLESQEDKIQSIVI